MSFAALTGDGINGFNSVFLVGHKPMKKEMNRSARRLFEKQSFETGRAPPAAARHPTKSWHRDPKSIGFGYSRIGREARLTFPYENSFRFID
jgi:hypothetical protein